ncbi:MAG: hypothetical protein ACSW8F_05795 [bacterium]
MSVALTVGCIAAILGVCALCVKNILPQKGKPAACAGCSGCNGCSGCASCHK